MRKFRRLFFGLLLMFVCVMGVMLNINAEEKEEYSIKVIADGLNFEMYLEGFNKEDVLENGYEYYVKFVKNVDEKLNLPIEPSSNSGFSVNSYNRVEIHEDTKDSAKIYISNDWYMLDGYTHAYVIKCRDSVGIYEISDNPVVVEKPALPSFGQRYEIFVFDDIIKADIKDTSEDISVFALFPHFAETEYMIGDHELNVKIGLINDNELLKKLSKDETGSLEELLKYAKKNDGTVFTYRDIEFYDKDIGDFDVLDGRYYYIYTYYTNEDGLYRNLEDITVALASAEHLSNADKLEWNIEELLWDKFVEKYKNTDLVKLYDDTEVNLEITSDENSLSVVLTKEEETFTTKFTYANGILKYEQLDKEDDMILVDSLWQMNAIYALSELKGYNVDKVSKWLEENKDKVLTLENDGIEYTSKEYHYKEDEDGVSTTIDGTILTSFELDIQNGLKSYNEEKISDYEFIFGENQKYKVNETKELKFEIDAEYSLFENVYVNGKVLDASNFTVSEGSTIVILKKEYLDTLNNGVHTLKVTFKDGGFAQTEFTIEKTVKNPNTGIAMKSAIIILVVVILGVGYLLIRKQSRFPKHN